MGKMQRQSKIFLIFGTSPDARELGELIALSRSVGEQRQMLVVSLLRPGFEELTLLRFQRHFWEWSMPQLEERPVLTLRWVRTLLELSILRVASLSTLTI